MNEFKEEKVLDLRKSWNTGSNFAIFRPNFLKKLLKNGRMGWIELLELIQKPIEEFYRTFAPISLLEEIIKSEQYVTLTNNITTSNLYNGKVDVLSNRFIFYPSRNEEGNWEVNEEYIMEIGNKKMIFPAKEYGIPLGSVVSVMCGFTEEYKPIISLEKIKEEEKEIYIYRIAEPQKNIEIIDDFPNENGIYSRSPTTGLPTAKGKVNEKNEKKIKSYNYINIKLKENKKPYTGPIVINLLQELYTLNMYCNQNMLHYFNLVILVPWKNHFNIRQQK